MTPERFTALASDPRIAPYIRTAPDAMTATALALYHGARLGLLTPAELRRVQS